MATAVTAMLAAIGLGSTRGALAAEGSASAFVCVAYPQAQPGQGAELAISLQQGLLANLGAAGVNVVALDAIQPDQAAAEARAKGCTHIVNTSLAQKHAGGFGNLLHKVAPLASALPILGGHMDGASAAAMAQNAAGALAQPRYAPMTGPGVLAGVKSGDTLTLQYQLVPVNGGPTLRSDSLRAKASADGEDVVSSLAQQEGSAVAGVTGGATGAAHFAGAAHSASPTGGIDCQQMASMPMAPMSVETCRKLMASQQTYQQATADPSAARPGDEQMSCAAIIAELKQQRYSAPDQRTLAQAQSASAAFQSRLAQRQAEVKIEAAKDQAELNAAMVADTVAQAATGGLADTRTAYKVQQRQITEMKDKGMRKAAEDQPLAQNMTGSTADLTSDMSRQLKDNPRLARLIQLASAKNCGGE